jgi:predicted TPR repeat methyltransferase
MSRLYVARSSGDLVTDRRYSYAQAYFDDGDWNAAADLALQVLERDQSFVPAWALLGRARLAQGREKDAGAALQQALALEPKDELGVCVELARLGMVSQGDALQPAFVRTLFDTYAESFEEHLTHTLGYRGPQQIRACLDRVAPGRRFFSALDLGCGTGLMGEAIRDRVVHLSGIDIAPAMVEKAREKGVYDDLAVAELTAYLQALPNGSCDLVLAADVIVYIGDPIHVFHALARAMTSGGFFAFSVQDAADAPSQGYRIGMDARFSHDSGFLEQRAKAAGLTIAMSVAITSRYEADRPVSGKIIILTC